MLRTESLEEITDGKRYSINDMVKAGTGGCAGCAHCCETMADTIVLSPYDIMNLELGTGKCFDQLIDTVIELKLHDGIILPNMKSDSGVCVMLDAGRCSIHRYRPDFCRLFPLGRLYEGDSFSYVLQTGQCDKANVKVKVKKWIDTDEYEQYSEYVLEWHALIRKAAAKVRLNEENSKYVMLALLKEFYQKPFVSKESFFDEIKIRINRFSSEILEA